MPTKGDDWTASEESTLQNHWDTHTAQEIADRLPNRTLDAVYSKHQRMKENGRTVDAQQIRDKIETEYDFNYQTEENDPETGLAQAFLWDESGERGIERTYTISEDGDYLVVREYLVLDGKINGIRYDKYRFEAFKPNTFPLSVLEEDQYGWIKSNHEADPELELEQYSDAFDREVEN